MHGTYYVPVYSIKNKNYAFSFYNRTKKSFLMMHVIRLLHIQCLTTVVSRISDLLSSSLDTLNDTLKSDTYIAWTRLNTYSNIYT